MQAAATLAAAGVAVDLYEAAAGIGGQFRLAGQVPGKEDFRETIRYFEHKLAELGVRVLTNRPACTAGLAGYTHVVVATGVLPRRPGLPGAGQQHVLDYRQAFADPAAVGRRVAVIGAGGIAVDLAHLLAGGPRSITIMRRGGRVGEGIGPTTRWAVLQQLRAAGVRMLTNVAYRRITPAGVEITGPGGPCLVPADTVILATGQEPEARLAAELAAAGLPHTVIGGALEAGGLNAVSAFGQGLRSGTAIARDLLGGTAPAQ